ncbi:cutinase family protein [Rhodococcus sp. NPDC058521]|uniref:cutinase family protein n=1 Tax=Rhodococcus sp. NPDC058521 TaxID=3346536 RepID=UPI00365958A7
MALREFFKRHRIASAATVPAMLGVTAIVAASFALPSGPQTIDTELTSSVNDCKKMMTISVAGRNDTPVKGTTAMLQGRDGKDLPAAMSGDHSSYWVDRVVNVPTNQVAAGTYGAVYIEYPANMATYEDAVAAGVENSQRVMREIQAACPDTQFSIVGYSEGADVARRVAMNIGNQDQDANGKYGIVDPARVLGVVILADAGRGLNEGPFPGAKDPYGRPDNFDQRYQTGKDAASGQGIASDTSGGFGALDGKIASFCSDGDLTCAAPENTSLLQLAANVGRQINVDAIERDGLTPATGQDVAMALSRIAFAAFADIQSQKDWMQSDETFLQVLLKVSAPSYQPPQGEDATPVKVATNASAVKDEDGEDGTGGEVIDGEELSPLAYLPQKLFREIVGLIATNTNTIPVIMSDPYQLTLGPNGTGHHFDYWRDANPNGGKPLTSAEYAAAWLTNLAKQAQNGKPLNTAVKPQAEDVADTLQLVAETKDATAAKAAASTADKPAGTAVPTPAAEATTTKSAAPVTSDAPAPSQTVEVTPEVAAPPAEVPTKDAGATVTEGSTGSSAPTTTTEAPVTTTTPVPVG